ncbi:hypothetical protein DIS24_g11457 [Lasiodiplodia hormozganensis]|uniref:BTB domain-containing protein n=1 Tax=Lasiodiplodia hormozganensis TaxID=869390 RepID=A0AA40C0R3_9PEZI|nr:hypothetical protein DIS24_g11457 [Lasiodiplodia hormozganensis]
MGRKITIIDRDGNGYLLPYALFRQHKTINFCLLNPEPASTRTSLIFKLPNDPSAVAAMITFIHTSTLPIPAPIAARQDSLRFLAHVLILGEEYFSELAHAAYTAIEKHLGACDSPHDLVSAIEVIYGDYFGVSSDTGVKDLLVRWTAQRFDGEVVGSARYEGLFLSLALDAFRTDLRKELKGLGRVVVDADLDSWDGESALDD